MSAHFILQVTAKGQEPRVLCDSEAITEATARDLFGEARRCLTDGERLVLIRNGAAVQIYCTPAGSITRQRVA